ncbi:MAG: 50S ribosomal protein L10 [Rhodospirillales bacterium]|nr:50S ribosomal protein L10 [Rhodospirillales bacterium]
MDRKGKEELVRELEQLFDRSALVVVTQYSGLTVANMTDLRGQMREAGASFRVVKNRLTKLALVGTDFADLAGLFQGPSAIAYSTDLVAAAKVVVDYAKKNEKLLIIGGAFSGKMLGVDDIQSLAKMPSLNEARAQIVGLLGTPATRIAGVLQAPAGQLARVLGAHAEQEAA